MGNRSLCLHPLLLLLLSFFFLLVSFVFSFAFPPPFPLFFSLSAPIFAVVCGGEYAPSSAFKHSSSFLPFTEDEASALVFSSFKSRRRRSSSPSGLCRPTIEAGHASSTLSPASSFSSSSVSLRRFCCIGNSASPEKEASYTSRGWLSTLVRLHSGTTRRIERRGRIDAENAGARKHRRESSLPAFLFGSSFPASSLQPLPSSLRVGGHRLRSRRSKMEGLRAGLTSSPDGFLHQRLPFFRSLPFALGTAFLPLSSCSRDVGRRGRRRHVSSFHVSFAPREKTDAHSRLETIRKEGRPWFSLSLPGGGGLERTRRTGAGRRASPRSPGVSTSLYMTTMDGDWGAGGGGGGTMYYHPARVFAPSPPVFLPTVEENGGGGAEGGGGKSYMDVLSWLFNRRRTILLHSPLTEDVASALIAQLLFLSEASPPAFSPRPTHPGGVLSSRRQTKDGSLSAIRRMQMGEAPDAEGRGLPSVGAVEEERERRSADERTRKEEEGEARGREDAAVEGRREGRSAEEVLSRRARDAVFLVDNFHDKKDTQKEAEANASASSGVTGLRDSAVLSRRRESSGGRLLRREEEKRSRRRRGTRIGAERCRQGLGGVSQLPVEMLISSPGGSVTAALSVLSIMESLPCDIITTCTGQAGGVATLLLAAGTPGLRRAFPTSRISLQQVEGSAHGQATELESQSREVEEVQALIFERISRFCKAKKPPFEPSSFASSSLSPINDPPSLSSFSDGVEARRRLLPVEREGYRQEACPSAFLTERENEAHDEEADDERRESETEREREEEGEGNESYGTGKEIEEEVCTSGGLFMSAQEALDFGLIDSIVIGKKR